MHLPSSLGALTLGCVVLVLGCGNKGDDSKGTGGSGAATGGAGGGAGTGGATGGASGSAGTSGSSASGGSAGSAAGSAGSPAGGGAGMSGSAGMGLGGMGAAGGGAMAGGAGAAGGPAPTWGVEARPTGQTCKRPDTQKTMPVLLSATGCVDPANPTKPAATMIPYGVITPLWSDGAEKSRFFALPDDMTIHVKDCTDAAAPDCQDPTAGGTYEDDGDWDFPDGTVFMKTFGFEGKLVETRLLVKRNNDNWWGYSYHWNDAQTDADLWDDNTDGYDQMVETASGMINWHFPSRAQCLQCHATAAGVSLGPETSQLNYDFAYPNGVTGNQIETLDRIGIFEKAPPMLPAYPAPSDMAMSVEERARSYLHINCGICHRPGGNFTDFDARYGTSLMDSLMCGAAEKAVPAEFMLTDPKRIDPGHPESSVVSLRMHTLDSEIMNFRMPQVGSRVVDATGTAAVDAWITSLTTCP